MVGICVLVSMLWAFIGYLACRVAYNQGRKDKWEEMARDYICFHKSVKIKPYIVTIEWDKDKGKSKKKNLKIKHKKLDK